MLSRFSDAELLRLFAYPGGKGRVLHWLYSIFPEAFTYIEVFGGSFVVVLNIKWSKYSLYIVNDLDPGIKALTTCFLLCPGVIEEAVRHDIHSQAVFNELKHYNIVNLSMIEKALVKLYLISHSVGRKGESFSYSLNAKKINNIKLTPAKIDHIAARMRRMHIFSEDFRDFISRMYKVKNGFMYLDPPYVISKKGRHYTLVFREKDHFDLSELLKRFEPKRMKWLLSYQKDPVIDKYYSDYYINDIEVPYSLTVEQKDGKTREIKKELLISNYNIKAGFTKSGDSVKRLEEFM